MRKRRRTGQGKTKQSFSSKRCWVLSQGLARQWGKPLQPVFLSLRDRLDKQVLKCCLFRWCTHAAASRELCLSRQNWEEHLERFWCLYSVPFSTHLHQAPSTTLRGMRSMRDRKDWQRNREDEMRGWDRGKDCSPFSGKPLHIPWWESTMQPQPKHIIYWNTQAFSQAKPDLGSLVVTFFIA